MEVKREVPEPTHAWGFWIPDDATKGILPNMEVIPLTTAREFEVAIKEITGDPNAFCEARRDPKTGKIGVTIKTVKPITEEPKSTTLARELALELCVVHADCVAGKKLMKFEAFVRKAYSQGNWVLDDGKKFCACIIGFDFSGGPKPCRKFGDMLFPVTLAVVAKIAGTRQMEVTASFDPESCVAYAGASVDCTS